VSGPFLHGPAKGASTHDESCSCHRCLAFQPGNALALKHGAYAVVEIQGRAREVEESLVAALRSEDLWRPSFAPTVAICAVTLVRVERAYAAIAQLDDAAENPLAAYLGERAQAVEKVREDLRRWTNTARQHLAELGLTPSALARIARDTGQGKAARASAAIRALADHVEREHAA
jgi:hypothetical protein